VVHGIKPAFDLVPSPLYSGERVRVRGRVREERDATTRAARARPLTPALSPEYRGEGVCYSAVHTCLSSKR
jgi:hypothetical protein